MTEERDGAPMTSSTVAGIDLMELADSLTKAQRAVVLAGSMRPKKWRTILRHAKRTGRIGRRLEFFARDTTHSINSFRLRPLGLAVQSALRARASLIEEERS